MEVGRRDADLGTAMGDFNVIAVDLVYLCSFISHLFISNSVRYPMVALEFY